MDANHQRGVDAFLSRLVDEAPDKPGVACFRPQGDFLARPAKEFSFSSIFIFLCWIMPLIERQYSALAISCGIPIATLPHPRRRRRCLNFRHDPFSSMTSDPNPRNPPETGDAKRNSEGRRARADAPRDGASWCEEERRTVRPPRNE